ncbi:multiple epidermal growth factor-like domains protein 10 [Mya arenaria]|uniref:multiple epidermal growth factor-like domains protein 10 n=1 Tax=Mya arenaria TaxID=6604 RepID=UPI0022E316FF|nr:multiple epidermal growth factor-like domains protein 10 [Mya arenaria]
MLQDCNHNTWGAECKQACGDCRDNITCNAVVGVCDVGCDPGVYVTLDKPMCNQACPNGLHGYNCTQTCQVGICYGSDLCDKKTGACLEGCLFAGYQEPSCTLECCNGTYGLGCAYKCGACADGTPCNKSTGLCPGECDPGFVGDMCTEKDGALAPASIALLVIGILFLVAGILGVLFALWVYKK